MAKETQNIAPKKGDDVLPENLQGKFKLAPGVMQKFADSDFGFVDLSEIGESLAEQLAGKGYLIKKSSGG